MVGPVRIKTFLFSTCFLSEKNFKLVPAYNLEALSVLLFRSN